MRLNARRSATILLYRVAVVLRYKHIVQIIVMAELVPWALSPRTSSVGVYVFGSHSILRRGCVDARIKSGHDESGGVWDYFTVLEIRFCRSLFLAVLRCIPAVIARCFALLFCRRGYQKPGFLRPRGSFRCIFPALSASGGIIRDPP